MRAERILQIARDESLARLVGFLWGLAEGLFFFIVPDVYITFATLFALRAGARAWLASIAGSVVAVSVIYLLAVILGLDYLSFLNWIPGISHGLIERVGRRVAAEGLPYTPLLVLGGVPLKVYAALGFSRGMSLWSMLLWTVYARIARIAPTFALAAAARLLLHRRIDERPIAWCVLLGGCWVAFYVFYFVLMAGG
jgi:hypothetical protein